MHKRLFPHTLAMLLLAALALLRPGPCPAADNGPEAYLELDTGIGYFAPPEVTYVYSPASRDNDIKTGEDTTWGVGFKAGKVLRGLDWSEDSLFGSAPRLELAFRYDDYDERKRNILPPNAADPAAGYGATGPWSGGVWDYKQEIGSNAFWLGLRGSDEDGEAAFVPYLGVGYQRYTQDWRLNTLILGTYYNTFDSQLTANSLGVRAGGDCRIGQRSGWQFTITPMVYANYVRADLDFHQSVTTALPVAVDDSMGMSFGSWGATLDFSATLPFDGGSYLKLTGGGVFNSRTPYGRPPTTSSGQAQIASGSSRAARAGIDFGWKF